MPGLIFTTTKPPLFI